MDDLFYDPYDVDWTGDLENDLFYDPYDVDWMGELENDSTYDPYPVNWTEPPVYGVHFYQELFLEGLQEYVQSEMWEEVERRYKFLEPVFKILGTEPEDNVRIIMYGDPINYLLGYTEKWNNCFNLQMGVYIISDYGYIEPRFYDLKNQIVNVGGKKIKMNVNCLEIEEEPPEESELVEDLKYLSRSKHIFAPFSIEIRKEYVYLHSLDCNCFNENCTVEDKHIGDLNFLKSYCQKCKARDELVKTIAKKTFNIWRNKTYGPGSKIYMAAKKEFEELVQKF